MERIHSRPALTHIKPLPPSIATLAPQLSQTHPLFLGLTSVWLTGLTAFSIHLPSVSSTPLLLWLCINRKASPCFEG